MLLQTNGYMYIAHLENQLLSSYVRLGECAQQANKPISPKHLLSVESVVELQPCWWTFLLAVAVETLRLDAGYLTNLRTGATTMWLLLTLTLCVLQPTLVYLNVQLLLIALEALLALICLCLYVTARGTQSQTFLRTINKTKNWVCDLCNWSIHLSYACIAGSCLVITSFCASPCPSTWLRVGTQL